MDSQAHEQEQSQDFCPATCVLFFAFERTTTTALYGGAALEHLSVRGGRPESGASPWPPDTGAR